MKGRNILLAICSPILFAAAAVAAPFESPIDITSTGSIYAHLPALNFFYGPSVTLDVVNTGSPDEFATVRANVPGGGGFITLDGAAYNLLQFHFHTEAEHEINGHRAEMELHLVHQDANGHLLVIGQLIEPGAFNPLYDAILSALPPSPGDSHTVPGFNLAGMAPGSVESFRYDGSLTTPPFTEGVQWIVLAEALHFSPAQIDAFRALFPHENSRGVQALNGRIVMTDVQGFTIPEPGGFVLMSLGGLVLFGVRSRRVRAFR